MNVAIVTLLLVFSIAFTLSTQVPNDNLLQPKHGRRHQHSKYEDKHTGKLKERDKIRGVHRKRITMKPLEDDSDNNKSEECCPTVSRWVELKLGISRENKLLEIYGGDKSPQLFFEVSCSNGTEDRQCRFVARPLQRHSRCVQRYSYTYALVRDFVVSSQEPLQVKQDWRMDYIKIPSGCSCEIKNHR